MLTKRPCHAQRPFLYYYCPTFLLYELSSPFLNIHWFLDKLDMTGSIPQLINGIFLLASFAGCRLLWGTYHSVWVFVDVYRAWRHGLIVPELLARDAGASPQMEAMLRKSTGLGSMADEVMIYAAGKDVPTWLALSYAVSNVTLNTLNWYWFGKMVSTVRKRFDPPFGTRKPEDKAQEENGVMDLDVQLGRSVYADGHKGVEVSGTAVRRRTNLQKEIEEEEGEVIL